VRRPAIFSGAVFAAILLAGVLLRPDRPLRIGTGVVAHDLCSGVFVSGLDPDRVFADSLAPRAGLSLIARGLSWRVDRTKHSVTASLLGLIDAHAVAYNGLGCILLQGEPPNGLPSTAELAALRSATPPRPELAGSEPEGSQPVEPASPKLKAALDQAFLEPDHPPFRRTAAVVILHDGRILAERYPPGYGVDTPILGFSLTKSVMNALTGILVRQGRLQPGESAPVAAWGDPGDPRHLITVEQLMRMTSGLNLDEENAGFADPSDQMLYLARDMAGFAEQARLVAAPGTRWAFSSGSTHILAQIIRDRTGGKPLDALGFAQRELFGPLGMRSPVVELDSTGTMIGSHYMLATTRDWARFGQLYLDDGAIDGRRILPKGWVEFSVRATLGTNYGAGFWTNRTTAPEAEARVAAGMPRDAYFASGNLGQRIVILPSQHMVIVRMGDATGPGNDMVGLIRLVRSAIEAVGSGA
jgi:CubicO group peptidase (beta-lactamase class C family)